MKRINNIYYKNISFSILLKMYQEIKCNCHNENKLFLFEKDLNTNILNIENKLLNNNYHFHNNYIFLIKDPKYRIIMSENIEDKIVNHWLSRYLLLPYLEPSFIDTNVATRKNKGSSYALKYLTKYLKELGLNNSLYALKIDISKYFYNIDHDILMSLLEKHYQDKNVLSLIYELIKGTNQEYINKEIKKIKENEIKKINNCNLSIKENENKTKEINNIPYYKYNKGLSIGGLSSQILAIFYLNEIDHFIKEKLKCKYYIRYMDDLILLDSNKDRLKNNYYLIKSKIEALKLKVNPKSNLYLINNAFSFLGFTFKIVNNNLIILPKNKTRKRINKKLKYLKEKCYHKYFLSLISYQGYFGKNYINYKKEYNYLSNKYHHIMIILYYNNEYKISINQKEIIVNSNSLLTNYLKNNHLSFIFLKKNKLIFNI